MIKSENTQIVTNKTVTTEETPISNFNFNQMVVEPRGEYASIELESYNSEGGRLSSEKVSLIGDKFRKYFSEDPETSPLINEAVLASRKAWVLILQKEGKLPQGKITEEEVTA